MQERNIETELIRKAREFLTKFGSSPSGFALGPYEYELFSRSLRTKRTIFKFSTKEVEDPFYPVEFMGYEIKLKENPGIELLFDSPRNWLHRLIHYRSTARHGQKGAT